MLLNKILDIAPTVLLALAIVFINRAIFYLQKRLTLLEKKQDCLLEILESQGRMIVSFTQVFRNIQAQLNDLKSKIR